MRHSLRWTTWAVVVACSSVDAAWLRPARSGDLETRYACGGGGTYAPETGIQWYREWDGCYVKYPSRVNMPHKIWTVGKMDNRPTTMRGGPNNTVLTLPYPGSYTPDATLIGNILAGEAPYIQQTIRYSPAHLGNVWTIANEPNWGPLFTPANYAREFHDYQAFIKSVDPTARIATGGVLVSNYYNGPGYAGTPWYDWLDQFRAAYIGAYGTPPPVDIWDIHPYDEPANSGGVTAGRKTINNIIAMRQYLDNAGLTSDPIEISEICCFTSDDALQVAFINELFAWLNVNAATYKVERWFWWGSTSVAFGPSGLFDGSYNRTYINIKGDAYMHQMGRVFVDPSFTPDATRIKGSMRNPYLSLAAVLVDLDAGSSNVNLGNIIYDFSTGLSYVASPSPQCDFDHDGDVDQEDFGHLQACLTGPTVMITDPACRNADLDRDADADVDDSSRLYRCFSGFGNIADPGCEN